MGQSQVRLVNGVRQRKDISYWPHQGFGTAAVVMQTANKGNASLRDDVVVAWH